MKPCTVCNMIKNLCDFANDPRIKSGKASVCKACKKERITRWKEANPETMRGYRRVSQKKSREVDNPVKVKARQAVVDAVRSGKLAKPALCSSCGDPGPVEGHHKDYSKPLDVLWLCRGCHLKEHAS